MRTVVVAALLGLGVAAIYGQTARHAFLNYDDDVYITTNPVVSGPFSLATLARPWGIIAANWHPLTWYSHRIDWALFGSWAGGHHLVSAALHAANAALLAAVLAALTGAFWRSALVAALFALHPLRVESVAWAAERKDVLSAFFWIATMGAYLDYVRRPRRNSYLAALALFALGLAAKPMLITLPLVLLLLDWWPLGRAGLGCGRLRGARGWVALAREKVPFLALAFAAGVATYWGQTRSTVPMVSAAWGTRLANGVVSYARYLLSFAWPAKLAFLYPYPDAGVPAAESTLAAAVLAGCTAAALLACRRRPWLLAGWLWYVVTLVPVIGIVQLGAQARSDRYTYLTMIGIALALAWSLGELAQRRPPLGPAIAGLCCAAAVALVVASARYVSVWRDDLTLMTYTAAATKDNYVVLNNLGSALIAAGRGGEAVAVLERTVRIKPDHCNAQYNLGLALLHLDRLPEAFGHLAVALTCYERGRYRKDYVVDARINLGAIELRLGRPAAAERHYRAALAIAPSAKADAGLRQALALRDATR